MRRVVVFFVCTDGLSVVKTRCVASVVSTGTGVSEKRDVSAVGRVSAVEASCAPEMRLESMWGMRSAAR